ncbi:MAG: aldo/keto reductase [Deltaproteobacteria bacterium]|nr:aldo/keto reductase [Deltaproteobacteria bacterium]
MRTRRFGRLGFEVSELSLGTWGLSGDAYGPVYEADLERVVELAVELGVTMFETSDVYGGGAMEKLLGDVLDYRTTQVVTKLGTCRDEPPRKRFDAASLKDALERSRDRLKRETIDVVLLHNPPAAALREGDAVEFLRAEKHAGRIAAWGVSAGDKSVASAAIDQSADVLELAYNLFSARTLHELTDRLAQTDTAVMARSVLAHGLLVGHWSVNKTFFEHDHRSRRWTPDALRYRIGQLQAVRQMVGGEILTMRAAALRFVLANQVVSTAVLGVRSQTQLRQLVREVGEGPEYLPDAVLAALPELLRRAGIEL